MKYWSGGVVGTLLYITPLLPYSTTPTLPYSLISESHRVVDLARYFLEAEGGVE